MNIDECWVRVIQELLKSEIVYCILSHLSHSDDLMYSIYCLSLCIVLLKCAKCISFKCLNILSFFLQNMCTWPILFKFEILQPYFASLFTQIHHTHTVLCIMTNLIMGQTVSAPRIAISQPLPSVFHKLYVYNILKTVHAELPIL